MDKTAWVADTMSNRAPPTFGEVSTPYGTLVSEVAIPLVDGSNYMAPFLNPFALLYFMSSVSMHVSELFHATLVGRSLGFAFYHDGVVPGNVLRPDTGRAFQATSTACDGVHDIR